MFIFIRTLSFGNEENFGSRGEKQAENSEVYWDIEVSAVALGRKFLKRIFASKYNFSGEISMSPSGSRTVLLPLPSRRRSPQPRRVPMLINIQPVITVARAFACEILRWVTGYIRRPTGGRSMVGPRVLISPRIPVFPLLELRRCSWWSSSTNRKRRAEYWYLFKAIKH